MTTNKTVTRAKRELVRALKEKRRLLKERLDKFTSYGGGQEITGSVQDASSSPLPNTNRMSLPEVLQYTLSFAMSGNNAATTAAVPSMSDALLSSPASKSVLAGSSVMMQVLMSKRMDKMTNGHTFRLLHFVENKKFYARPKAIKKITSVPHSSNVVSNHGRNNFFFKC